MRDMKQNALRLPALILAAALAVPALAAAAPQEPPRPFRAGALAFAAADGESPQILIRGPRRPRVVVGRSGNGYLGVQLMDLTEELREFYGAPKDAGTLVSRVADDSPAAAAGFEVGDVITRIAGEPTENSWDVVRSVTWFDSEEQLAVEVIRDGAPVTLNATLGERRRGGIWVSNDGSDLGWHRFEMPDVEGLELLRELPAAISDETREAMRAAIEKARERMSEFDHESLAERLAEAEERLQELERKLAERER